jgi:hypothetical protein
MIFLIYRSLSGHRVPVSEEIGRFTVMKMTRSVVTPVMGIVVERTHGCERSWGGEGQGTGQRHETAEKGRLRTARRGKRVE